MLPHVHFYRPQTMFAKVMFLHLSVSHSVHRGGVPGQVPPPPRQVSPRAGTPPGAGTPPPRLHAGIRSTSRRYTSHWNAFLLHFGFYKMAIFKCSDILGKRNSNFKCYHPATKSRKGNVFSRLPFCLAEGWSCHRPLSTGPCPLTYSNFSNLKHTVQFNLVHFEVRTVGKRAGSIRLK